MNQQYFLNHILIKSVIEERNIKDLYAKENSLNRIIIWIYKYSKYYKKIVKINKHHKYEKEVEIAYTSDTSLKIENIKQRILKHKITSNFNILVSTLFLLMLFLSFICFIILYNNSTYIECSVPYTHCPLTIYVDFNVFLKNYKLNKLNKSSIYLFYTNIKQHERKILGNLYENTKRIYRTSSTEKIKCTHCELYYKIKNEETLDDLFEFEEKNKCVLELNQDQCINLKDDTIKNRRIHIYKKYSGSFKNTDYYFNLKKHKKTLSTNFDKTFVNEQVVIKNRLKYVYPFIKDYNLNFDYYKFYDRDGTRIPINEESLHSYGILNNKEYSICRHIYMKKFRNSIFFWLCPGFYRRLKKSDEYRIASYISKVLNFKNVGYGYKNKHLVEMSKMNPTKTILNHFGYVTDSLKLPFKIHIYNRFRNYGKEVLINSIIKQVYTTFLCPLNRYSENFEKYQKKETIELETKIYDEDEVGGRIKDFEVVTFFNEKELLNTSRKFGVFYNERENKTLQLEKSEQLKPSEQMKKSEQLEQSEQSWQLKEEEYEEDTYDDNFNTDEDMKEIEIDDRYKEQFVDEDHIDVEYAKCESEQIVGIEKDDIHMNVEYYTNTSHEGTHKHIKNVLVKEKKLDSNMNTKHTKSTSEKLNKEIIIKSAYLFFGKMEELLYITFILLVLICIVILLLVYALWYVTKKVSIYIVLLDDEEEEPIEEIPKCLKRLSKGVQEYYDRSYSGSLDFCKT